MSKTVSTLSTGKYTVEFDKDGTSIFTIDAQNGKKQWLASVSDPNLATIIVEGLILVEHKRFYHPEAGPTFSTDQNKPLPPFLKKAPQAS